MLPTLTIKEIRMILCYKKNSSAKKWLARKGIEIQDKGSKSEYVIQTDFEVARYGAYIKNPQKQHPNNWRDVLKAHENKDILSLIEFEANPNLKSARTKYKPVTSTELKISKDWDRELNIDN